MEKNIKGISILESLVCLVIIGIGFVAMLQLSSFSINAMDRSIEKNKIRTPQLFTNLQQLGNVAEDEMFRVFNMGVGMIVVSENEIAETDHLYKIGEVMQGKKGVVYG